MGLMEDVKEYNRFDDKIGYLEERNLIKVDVHGLRPLNYYIRKQRHFHFPPDMAFVLVSKLVGEEIVWCRGIAVCSPRDNFCRRTGRVLALDRAIRAWEMECSSEPLELMNLPHIDQIRAYMWLHELSHYDLPETGPGSLTQFEQKIIAKTTPEVSL